MQSERLEDLLTQFHQVRVAVLGDFFLDLYIILDRSLSEFSLETHKEAFQATKLRGQPGAAGVVTNNLQALGAQSAAIGYTGRDGNGHTLRTALAETGVNLEYFIESKARFTPTYTKPLMHEVDGTTVELNRMDVINRVPNPPELNKALLKNVEKALDEYDGLLVVEQVKQDNYGVMSPLLRGMLTTIQKTHPEKPILVDSRHFGAEYKQLSLKVNLSEAAGIASSVNNIMANVDNEDALDGGAVCAHALWEANQQPVFITLGSAGIAGMADENFFHHPAYQIEGPIDIVGAGDSVLAGIGLALCAGATPREAAYIGNLVGSITVQQIGTTGIATPKDLLRRHTEYQQQLARNEESST
jgi:rfaE bifunctional protein kinase chain/domain